MMRIRDYTERDQGLVEQWLLGVGMDLDEILTNILPTKILLSEEGKEIGLFTWQIEVTNTPHLLHFYILEEERTPSRALFLIQAYIQTIKDLGYTWSIFHTNPRSYLHRLVHGFFRHHRKIFIIHTQGYIIQSIEVGDGRIC